MTVTEAYQRLGKIVKQGLISPNVTEAIIDLCGVSLESLSKFDKHSLNSSIEGKEYFVYVAAQDKYSRPINDLLFNPELLDIIHIYRNRDWNSIPQKTLQSLLYTIGMSYCAAVDVVNKSNKKSPSSFYEYFIGNIFAREYNVNPVKQIKIELAEIRTTLPTDYLFQPDGQFIRIHLPIKLSTRERSIQAWAHQRVLEGIHGHGTYRGVMVVQTETNFISKNMSVVEVCLPDQWRLYQMYISQMSRIYYLDLPQKYGDLPMKHPHIQVKPFCQFFFEKEEIINPTKM